MSNELILDSLRRRMRAMHSLYEDATATMDVKQVNHVGRDAVLPIAFSLFRYVNMEDVAYRAISGGEPMIWNDEWAARVQLAINDHGRELSPGEMVGQRVGDCEAFIEYMDAVWRGPRTFSPASTRRPSATCSCADRCRRSWRTRTRPVWRARTASHASTPWSAGVPARTPPHGRDRTRTSPRGARRV